ncbi:MAG TPA: hypothetical protein VFP84_22505 [Kofleriaceae bacterium]|nr:hypothetical protein [Kofleriaceae bacterium]
MATPRPEAPHARVPAIATLLAIASAGHVLAVLAAASDAVPRSNAVVVGLAGATFAIVALTALAGRAVAALIAGHAVIGALLVAAIAPRTPSVLALTALVAAVGLDAAGLVLLRRRALAARPARPLAIATRVAAVALVGQAALELGADSAWALAMPLRAALYVALAALGTSLLASWSFITLQLRRRWLIAGLVAWSVGWLASTADTGALVLWSLGAPYPLGAHQLQLDPTSVQIVATLGGLALGVALVREIREPRFQHSALILLAGCAVFGVIAALREHRIELAAGLPDVVALRRERDFAAAITNVTLAGVLWMYWRRVVSPRGASHEE